MSNPKQAPPSVPEPPRRPAWILSRRAKRKRIVQTAAIAIPLLATIVTLSFWAGGKLATVPATEPAESEPMQVPMETTVPPATMQISQNDTPPAENHTSSPEKEPDVMFPNTPTLSEFPAMNGAISYNGHFYGLYDLGMKWTEAKSYCEDLGGHLVTITSPEEQEAIQNLLENSSRLEYWIGAHYVDGSYVWVTGEPFVYGTPPGEPWGEGQPDHDRAGTDNAEEYVHIFSREVHNGVNFTFPRYTWNDIMNDINAVNNRSFTTDTLGFICEWEPDSTD